MHWDIAQALEEESLIIICFRWVVARPWKASPAHLWGPLQPSNHPDRLWQQDLCGRLQPVSGFKISLWSLRIYCIFPTGILKNMRTSIMYEYVCIWRWIFTIPWFYQYIAMVSFHWKPFPFPSRPATNARPTRTSVGKIQEPRQVEWRPWSDLSPHFHKLLKLFAESWVAAMGIAQEREAGEGTHGC